MKFWDAKELVPTVDEGERSHWDDDPMITIEARRGSEKKEFDFLQNSDGPERHGDEIESEVSRMLDDECVR